MPSGSDKLTDIDIEFRDGRMSCLGQFSLEDGEMISTDGETVVQRGRRMIVEVVEEGMLYTERGESELEPGVYIVSDEGLWLKIDGESAA